MISDHIKNVCKIGQGAECCKYLAMTAKGWECQKVDPDNKKIIEMEWAKREHVSQGDNCEGKENLNS